MAMALAPSGPMAFQLRLIEVSVLFSSRALARAVAPSGPIVLESRLIEVRVVFLVRAAAIAMASPLWAYGIPTKINRGKRVLWSSSDFAITIK